MPRAARPQVLAALALLVAAPLRAEGVKIVHRPVSCLVEGRNARLDACFAPVSKLARARVYFRVADGPPDWYYVEMQRGTPCFSGVLPRPKRELVGRRVQYYVDTLDRSFEGSRSDEFEAPVVRSPTECDSRLPVPPLVDESSVAVFPGMPAGFAGAGGAAGAAASSGVSATTLALVLGGGAVVVGGGLAILGSGGSSGPSTTAPPVTSPPETLPPTTTTTTVPGQVPFVPVFKVRYQGVLVDADVVSGNQPVTVVFNMCESTGPYELHFGVQVDGAMATSGCRSVITFTASGAAPGYVVQDGVRQSATSRIFDVKMLIHSAGPKNEPKASRALTVQVNAPGGGCPGDTQGPLVAMTQPPSGSVYPSPSAYPVHFEASASDAGTGNSGIAFVEYKINYTLADQLVLGPVTGAAPWPLDWTETQVNAYLGTDCAKFLQVQAYAQDNCGNGTYSAPVQVIINNTGSCITPDPKAVGGTGSLTWVSDLGVPGGAGQVVVNAEAAFPRAGRVPLAVRLVRGENRVEATLVEGRGPGMWRFELGAVPGLVPDSLRVVAGDAARVASDGVTFRMQGRVGERAVFVFRVEP
jgi:hypothetical protein